VLLDSPLGRLSKLTEFLVLNVTGSIRA